MSLSTNRVMSAPMGFQPCLKKATQMAMMIQNKHDSMVQCIGCVHCPMCSPLLKNVTPPPQPYISAVAFFHRLQKITPPPTPLCDDMFAHSSKLAAPECPREICESRFMAAHAQIECLPSVEIVAAHNLKHDKESLC